jgi:glutathione S-transferase
MLDLSTPELEPAVNSWIGPILGKNDYDAKTVNMAIAQVKAVLGVLDKTLGSAEFLCGANLTIADLSIFNALALPYRMVFDAKFINSYKNLKRWFDGLKARQEILGVWGKIHECKTVHPFPKTRSNSNAM